MSLDQHRPVAEPQGPATAAGVPSLQDAVASALGSVRAEGLEPDADGLALLDAIACGELSIDEAIQRALALYAA